MKVIDTDNLYPSGVEILNIHAQGAISMEGHYLFVWFRNLGPDSVREAYTHAP